MTDDTKPQTNKVSLITKKGVQLPTIKTQNKSVTPRSGLIGADSKEFKTNQQTTSHDRQYAVRKYINTAIEQVKIEEEREKRESLEEGAHKQKLSGKFLKKIADSRSDKNDELFQLIKKEAIQKEVESRLAKRRSSVKYHLEQAHVNSYASVI